MNRLEIDVMWQKAMHEAIKEGCNLTRYHFAALVREQAYREDKSLTLGFEVTEREWVELTDDEIFKLGKEKKFPDTDPVYFGNAVIAAWKEKNK